MRRLRGFVYAILVISIFAMFVSALVPVVIAILVASIIISAIMLIKKIIASKRVDPPHDPDDIQVRLSVDNGTSDAAYLKHHELPSEGLSISTDIYIAYGMVLLLSAYDKTSPIPDEYPLYFERECHLTNPASLHYKLICDGYLVPSSISEMLFTLKVPELKMILNSYGLKTSGKKEELVSRILSYADPDALRSYFKGTECYSISSKGAEFLSSHQDYVVLHRYSQLGVGLQEYESCKRKCHLADCTDILIRIYRSKCHSDRYSMINHTFLMQLYDDTHVHDKALFEFLVLLYLRANYYDSFVWINEMSKYLSLSDAAAHVLDSARCVRVFSTQTASFFVSHYQYFTTKMVDTIYSHFDLPVTVISKHDFLAVLSEMVTHPVFDFEKWNRFLLMKFECSLNCLESHG